MENTTPLRNTFDRTVYSLCLEIDALREEVRHWQEKYEEERSSNIEMTNERIKDSHIGIANALMFAFHVKDDENGNLVINREDRKALAESYK